MHPAAELQNPRKKLTRLQGEINKPTLTVSDFHASSVNNSRRTDRKSVSSWKILTTPLINEMEIYRTVR